MMIETVVLRQGLIGHQHGNTRPGHATMIARTILSYYARITTLV